MNVFCYQRTLRNISLCSMLGVALGLEPEFGYKPGVPLHSGKVDRTEIDLKLGDLLVEAKLTENDFQIAPLRLIERHSTAGRGNQQTPVSRPPGDHPPD